MKRIQLSVLLLVLSAQSAMAMSFWERMQGYNPFTTKQTVVFTAITGLATTGFVWRNWNSIQKFRKNRAANLRAQRQTELRALGVVVVSDNIDKKDLEEGTGKGFLTSLYADLRAAQGKANRSILAVYEDSEEKDRHEFVSRVAQVPVYSSIGYLAQSNTSASTPLAAAVHEASLLGRITKWGKPSSLRRSTSSDDVSSGRDQDGH